ncbi:MAG: asparagine synthase (glutamine-hydrolyzing) [Hyphomicrobiales bacterium]
MDADLLVRFAQAVQQFQGDRGPDDFRSLRVTDHLYFFHNSLAIIDPGRAHQPMEDGHGVITYNGEVYNFAELRFPDEVYRLHSDTEVLLKGLNRQGVRFLDRTHSMFGFGYYDRLKAELLLVRDRVGVKQIYYIDTRDVFAFASTLKPLMQLSRAEIDQDAVFDYYFNRAIKAPRTLFRDIRQLEAGTVLRFDARGRRIASVKPWWMPPRPERAICDEGEALAEVDRLIRRAVEYRLVSDVPVGAYLSGGVDSSLIAAIASESTPTLETFSVAMPDRRLDESHYARAVAEGYGLKHHSIVAEPSAFIGDIENWALIQDDMVADPSALMLYQLSKFARDAGFKVMLSGEGADEAFGGYNAQFRYQQSRRYHPLFKLLRPGVGVVDWLLANRSKMRQFAHQLITGPAYYGVATIFEPVIFERLFRGNVSAPRSAEDLKDAIHLDLRDRLPNDLLTRTDRATMGASIEARVPFLSHELMSYSARLSDDLLIKGRTQKYLLKRLAERYMPRANIYRPKRGFDLPLAGWLRGPLRPMFHDLLANSWQGDLIDLDFVGEIATLHQARTINGSDKLWAFMMLELNRRVLVGLRQTHSSVPYARYLPPAILSSVSFFSTDSVLSTASLVGSMC